MNHIIARCSFFNKETGLWEGKHELVAGMDTEYVCCSTKEEIKRAEAKKRKWLIDHKEEISEGKLSEKEYLIENDLDFEIKPTTDCFKLIEHVFKGNDNVCFYDSKVLGLLESDGSTMTIAFLKQDDPRNTYYGYNTVAAVFLKFLGFEGPKGMLLNIRGPVLLFHASKDFRNLLELSLPFYQTILGVYNHNHAQIEDKLILHKFESIRIGLEEDKLRIEQLEKTVS